MLLGLIRDWFRVLPEEALAPVILPVIVPTVQAKLLGVLDVRAIPVPAPLHEMAVAPLVTEGVGLTVTVIVNVGPAHEPVVEVGITRYSTVPAVELPGLVSG